MASRFIPPKKVDALIKKLSGFASVHQSGELRRSLYTDKQARPVGEKAYITVDMLYKAESTGTKIICKYFEYGADKKKEYRHNRQDYHFSPYGLVWNNDRYYVVGWSDRHEKIITLRVDRIAAPKPQDFDMAFYAEGIIQMYDGVMRDVTLHCKNEMMKHIIDRFGENVKTEYAKLTAERNRLNQGYVSLKDEVKEAEQIRSSVCSILRQEQREQQPRKAQDMEL